MAIKEIIDLYKTYPIVFWSLALPVCFLIGMLSGIYVEASMSVSKDIPYLSSIHSPAKEKPKEVGKFKKEKTEAQVNEEKAIAKLKEEKDKIVFLISSSKIAIGHWKEYHNGSIDAARQRQKAHELIMENNQFFQSVDQAVLNVTWKIWLQYFYAYQQFICADLDSNNQCIKDAIRQINLIESYDRTKLRPQDLRWLRSQKIFTYLALLKAHVYAVKLKLEPTALNKMFAIEALKALGGQRSLVGNKYNQDRILKPVYDFAFPKSLLSPDSMGDNDKSK